MYVQQDRIRGCQPRERHRSTAVHATDMPPTGEQASCHARIRQSAGELDRPRAFPLLPAWAEAARLLARCAPRHCGLTCLRMMRRSLSAPVAVSDASLEASAGAGCSAVRRCALCETGRENAHWLRAYVHVCEC